jgi:hypothetical protein
MSDFKSSHYAGQAYFNIDGNKRWILMDKSTFNAVCQLLNDARKVGEQDATKKLVQVVTEWAKS